MPDDTNSDDLGLLGRSAAVVALRSTVRRVADAPYPVLITGVGVGKNSWRKPCIDSVDGRYDDSGL